VLLARGFAVLVGVAVFIAAPLAYLAAERWLEGFAYRIDLGLGLFLLAGGLALVVALATIGYHALRAATSDPVEALRYE
jgi:putative ABC transport system permease protein